MAFLGGVLLVQQLAELPTAWWALLLAPFLLLAMRHPGWLIPAFFVAGLVWASVRAGSILQDELPAALEGVDLTLEGTIADIPKNTEFGQRFVFAVSYAQHDDRTVSVPRRVLLSTRGHGFQPRAGERWRLRARLSRPHGFRNPGGFDYEAYLFRERIRAKGSVRPEFVPQPLASGATWAVVDRWRQQLGERLRAQLPEHPHAGIVVALANGDGRGLTPEQWEVLRRTGTMHLVAISGLHISLVAGVVFFLARWLWALPGTTVLRLPAPQFGAVCALLAAAGYAALAGFVVPTQRALIMLTVALGGQLLRRRHPPGQLLAVAALAVMIYDPLAVLATGFWLSFAAVAVILWVAHDGLPRRGLWWKWGYLQWAIALGMLPLMLVLFQQVSLVAPLANMIAVPVFDFLVVPLTLLGALLLGPLPIVSGWLLHAAAWLLHLLWYALAGLSALPFSQWSQPAPAAWALLVGMIGVALLLAPRGWPARWVGAVWLLPVFLTRPPTPAPGEVWLHLLDVGQGLAAVVRTHDHALLFDTGPRFGAFDTGRAVVEPALRALGVRRLDAMVLSHGDNDHVGGAESVLRTVPVQRLLASVPETWPDAQACRAGMTWQWDGVEFRMLAPDEEMGRGRRNDASCVLQVRGRYGGVLLPADIEARSERRLVRAWGDDLRADVLVAPHHGSKTSSTPEFIAAVAPRHVLFPVGYRNRHRHPHPDVVRRYAEAGAVRHDSPGSGELEIRLRADGLEVIAYRDRERRYWHAR